MTQVTRTLLACAIVLATVGALIFLGFYIVMEPVGFTDCQFGPYLDPRVEWGPWQPATEPNRWNREGAVLRHGHGRTFLYRYEVLISHDPESPTIYYPERVIPTLRKENVVVAFAAVLLVSALSVFLVMKRRKEAVSH